jgi:hypothetical protein
MSSHQLSCYAPPVDYSEGCGRIRVRVNLIKEDIMSKENNKQKPNAKKKPQHTLKEKRHAKKDKAEGKPFQIMPS